MALGSLQNVIEKLQKTIEAHREYLTEYETRTRQVLIDPLLQKLRWDVSNPNIVQLEYRVKEQRADYVLMSKGKPVAVVEAKSLGSNLKASVIGQALAYAKLAGISYAIVTDGDKWEMYDVFKPAAVEKSLLMKLELSQQSAHKNAKQALAMRKPNLTAKKPDFKPPKSARNQSSVKPNKLPKPQPPDDSPKNDNERYPFASAERLYPKHTKPNQLKIDNNLKKIDNSWTAVIHEVVAWLADERILSVNDCPIGTATYTFIGYEGVNPNGTPFKNPQGLSNGLILQGGYLNTQARWQKLRQLLIQLKVDRRKIEVFY